MRRPSPSYHELTHRFWNVAAGLILACSSASRQLNAAGVPRLFVLALEALRKYHLATLAELEPSSPRLSASPASTRALLPQPSTAGGNCEDSAVRGGSAAAEALASASGQARPVVVQFASASRENLLALKPSTRSMSTQSLREASFLDSEGQSTDGTELLGHGQGERTGSSRSLRQLTTIMRSGSARPLARTWSGLVSPAEQAGRSMERSQSSRIAPLRSRSRSPFQLGQMSPGPSGSGTGSSSTAPLRAQGRAAGSGVHTGAGSSTWHGANAFEDSSGHGHFRFFSCPGAADEAAPSSSSAAAAAAAMPPVLPGDILHDTLDGIETESEMELHWALYSAQMESTRHSAKAAGGGGSGLVSPALSDIDSEAAAPEQPEPLPLLSRMVASVDRAAHRVPQMFGPGSLRAARPAGGGDNSSVHSSRSSVGVLERSARQQSVVSALGSVDDERRCPICMDERSSVRVAGCRHGMCVACARTLCTSVSRAPVCPMCRKAVDTFERIDAPMLG